jgi:type IV secretory pathway VirB2 component (pilin)
VADQAAPGTMAEAAGSTGAHGLAANTGAHGLDVQTGLSHIHASHHGRPASWVAVAIIVVGFIVGGIALVAGPTWWLFWTGTGIVVIGAIFAASVRIFDDWY